MNVTLIVPLFSSKIKPDLNVNTSYKLVEGEKILNYQILAL